LEHDKEQKTSVEGLENFGVRKVLKID